MKRVSVALVAAAIGCGATPQGAPNVDSIVIEPPMAHYVRELDPREQKEQIRDWAVLGTIASLGVTPEQAAAATYEIPPARLPYLDELYSFEYGRGRRVYLGERVLLFRDADDPDPTATLGRLADRIRMETGEIPSVVEVFAVHDERDEGLIRVERGTGIGGRLLFSPEYGYVEGSAASPADIAAWLAKADDLTFAQAMPGGRLLLGGRRFDGTRTANLTIDDVAALYQAHEELDAPFASARELLELLPQDARAAAMRAVIRVRARQQSTSGAEKDGEVIASAVPLAMQPAVIQAIQTLARGVTPSPGFSLDPEWVPDPDDPRRPLMLARIRAFAKDPCRELRSIAALAGELEEQEPDATRRTARVVEAIGIRNRIASIEPYLESICAFIKIDLSPDLIRITDKVGAAAPEGWDAEYHRLIQSRSGSTVVAQRLVAEVADVAFRFYRADTAIQCGRYSGLKGTRAGMTLFYTDLLAKLWESTDYGLSAPVVAVPGFVAAPHVNLPSTYEQDLARSPSTRVWFGARTDAASRTTSKTGDALLLEHRFTRVYAAGSNPIDPDVEAQPGEDSRRTLGWWDRHFDDVADHEQEYHRLNQITKWALVTASLHKSRLSALLAIQPVQRDLEFLSWHAANRARLRFSEPIPSAHRTIAGKECLPLIASYSFPSVGGLHYISGGVSTVPRAAVSHVPRITPTGHLSMRRSHVADLGAGTAGTATRAVPEVANGNVTFARAAAARTRTAAGEVQLGAPAVKYTSGPARGSLEIQAGGSQRPIGALQLHPGVKRVELRWIDGVIEHERRGAMSVPDDLASADRAAASGQIVDAARMYERVAPPPGIRLAKDLEHASAQDLARMAVVDAARRRPAAVLRTAEELARRGAQLSAETQQAIVNAVGEIGSSGAAGHMAAALRTGGPLKNAAGTLVLERGRVILTRDIESLPVTATTPKVLAGDISDAPVYIDERFLIAREGLIPDLGPRVSHLPRTRNVTVKVMDGDDIGAVLPDKLVVRSTGMSWRLVSEPDLLVAGSVMFLEAQRGERGARGRCEETRQGGEPSADCAEQR